MNIKADYVRNAPQSRKHECHWRGCTVQVPPAMWGCKRHWFMLPAHLRAAIWRAYSPGQEERLDPSETYMEVAHKVQEWIASQAKS